MVDNKKNWRREEEVEADYRNSAAEIFKVEKSVWESRVRENANKENLGSCQIVENNYLLPLITDLVDNMGSKWVFTKIDLQ